MRRSNPTPTGDRTRRDGPPAALAAGTKSAARRERGRAHDLVVLQQNHAFGAGQEGSPVRIGVASGALLFQVGEAGVTPEVDDLVEGTDLADVVAHELEVVPSHHR